MRNQWTRWMVAMICLCGASRLVAQQTVGLFQYDAGTTDGYVLLAPLSSTSTYLIDNCGREVQHWTSAYQPGASVKLLPDGRLMRTGHVTNTDFTAGGVGGRVEMLDWNSNVDWYYEHSSSDYAQHHDVVQMPNGNIMFITWEAHSRAEAITAGRDSALLQQRLWPDAILEVQPTTPGSGNIVWEWHAWDHMIQDLDSTKANFGVVADHPELINLNYVRPGATNYQDWLHANAIEYNPTLDQIAISIHNFDEIWLIDHSTTTAEAASHSGGLSGKGGDLLYRFGNPATYDRGDTTQHVFWGMHNVQWVPAGDQYAGQLMVFNNGFNRAGAPYSSVDIWEPPTDLTGQYVIAPGQPFGPSALTWSYQDNPQTNLYSQIISGAQRLPGNHTLICEGTSGRVREIDSAGNKLWEYVSPIEAAGPLNQGSLPTANFVFRAYRYLPDFSGLTGQVLTPGAQLEGNPLPLPGNCPAVNVEPAQAASIQIAPQPFGDEFRVSLRGMNRAVLEIYDLHGRKIAEQKLTHGETQVAANQWPAGMYVLKLQGTSLTQKVLKF